VLLGYPVWLLASLRVAPNSRGTVLAVFAALVLLGVAAAWVQRRALAEFLQQRWRLIVAEEVAFLVFFAAFALIRYGNPDLWHPVMGGEKPMDLAYLNAILKSTWFPPYDPWFAGGSMNYYYLGHALVATLIKATGIVPTVAYNLAIPTLFAMTAMGACCVVVNLVPAGVDEGRWLPRALRFGLLGAALVAVLGNLGEARLLLSGLRALGTGAAGGSLPVVGAIAQVFSGLGALLDGAQMPFRPEWWYWNASRVMANGEINEFPFFSFLYADLHAHVIALPLTLLALASATGFVVRPEAPAPDAESHGRRALFPAAVTVRLAFLALVVGLLWGANTWDYPTYLLLALGALAIDAYHERRRADATALGRLAARGAVLIALSLALFAPYHANYGSAYSSVALWHGERTDLGAYLTIHALPLLLVATMLGVSLARPGIRNTLVRAVRPFIGRSSRRARARALYAALVQRRSRAYEWCWTGVAVLLAVLVFALLRGQWALLLGLPLIVLGLVLALDRGAGPAERWLGLLAAAGAALTIGVEYVVLAGDIGRMNTVFKFYLQAWTLFGVSLSVGLAGFAAWTDRQRPVWGKVAWAVLAVLFIGVMLYPPFAARAKIRDRFSAEASPRGLDGMAYMDRAQYFDNGQDLLLADDKAAMLWLMNNVQGSPTILEAQIPEYRWGSRFSVYTGLPAIQGWNWHQRQQRSVTPSEVVERRVRHVTEMYNTLDPVRTRELLDHYGVKYVIVGELERAYYAPGGLAKFDALEHEGYLRVAYRGGAVTILEIVAPDREPAAAAATFLEERFSDLDPATYASPRTFDSPEMQ